MDIFSTRSWLREAAGLSGLLALLTTMAAQAYEAPPRLHKNLHLEGRLPGATLLHLEWAGDKESSALSMTLVDGELERGVHIAGDSRRLLLRAEGPEGKLLYEGEAEFEAKDGFIPQVAIELESSLDGTPAEVRLASHRLEVEFAGVEREGALYTRISANVLDADGLRLDLKEGEIDWQIDDPWINENLLPCPDSSGASLCVEFLPRKPDGTLVTFDACYRDGICRRELVPPNPAVWRKVALGLGSHGCALKLDGRVYCWGRGEEGQLGYAAPKDCNSSGASPGNLGCSAVAERVQCASGPCVFKDIAAGLLHTCALDLDRYAWCWGENSRSELGVGAAGDGTPVPQPVLGGQRYLSIHAGLAITCGLTIFQEVFCWGSNSLNIVPHSTALRNLQPTLVPLPEEIGSIDTFGAHACALAVSGNLYCWGSTGFSALGEEGYFVPATPCAGCPNRPQLMQDRVRGLLRLPVNLMSTGLHGSCANTSDGRTTCWGKPLPDFGIVVPLKELSRAELHYCAITQGGGTLCAGSGALGDGNFWGWGHVRVSKPFNFFRRIDTGQHATCAIGADEQLYCWGDNKFGVTGLGGTSGHALLPQPMFFLSKLPAPNTPTRRP